MSGFTNIFIKRFVYTIFARLAVIPAKAGIHLVKKMDTRFRGYDTNSGVLENGKDRVFI